MINETVKLKGDLVITVLDKDGKVKERREEKNLIVSAGLTFICSRMANATAGVMSHMAVGSGKALVRLLKRDCLTQLQAELCYVEQYSRLSTRVLTTLWRSLGLLHLAHLN